MVWTADHVERRLFEAYRVLQAMPDVEMRYLRDSMRSHMPDVVHDEIATFAAQLNELQAERKRYEDAGVEVPEKLPSERTPLPKYKPSGPEIDRMEEVLIGTRDRRSWLLWLPHRRRRLVWRKLTGWPIWKLAAKERVTDRTINRWWRQALATIAEELETLDCG